MACCGLTRTSCQSSALWQRIVAHGSRWLVALALTAAAGLAETARGQEAAPVAVSELQITADTGAFDRGNDFVRARALIPATTKPMARGATAAALAMALEAAGELDRVVVFVEPQGFEMLPDGLRPVMAEAKSSNGRISVRYGVFSLDDHDAKAARIWAGAREELGVTGIMTAEQETEVIQRVKAEVGDWSPLRMLDWTADRDFDAQSVEVPQAYGAVAANLVMSIRRAN